MPVVIKGVLTAYLASLASFAVYSLMLVHTDISEQYISIFILISSIASVAISCFCWANTASKSSALSGAYIGLIYMMGIYFVGSVVSGFNLNIKAISSMLIGALIGSITCTIRLNIKNSKHKSCGT